MPAPPSRDLLKFAGEINRRSNTPVLDSGCGYGRNAIALAARGMTVVCADQDWKRLEMLARFGPARAAAMRTAGGDVGQLHTVRARLDPSRWPFGKGCFVGIVCVHFLDTGLFPSFRSSLVEGGCLYIETFGGHGGNYLALPKASELRDLLSVDFELLFYHERKVGPVGHDAVTVKLFGRKRSSLKA